MTQYITSLYVSLYCPTSVITESDLDSSIKSKQTIIDFIIHTGWFFVIEVMIWAKISSYVAVISSYWILSLFPGYPPLFGKYDGRSDKINVAKLICNLLPPYLIHVRFYSHCYYGTKLTVSPKPTVPLHEGFVRSL